MVTEVYDLETLSNLFTYTGYSRWEDKWYQFTIHSLRDESEQLYQHLTRDKYMYQVGFNNESFDYPLIHYFLENFKTTWKSFTAEQIAMSLYEKAQLIIQSDSYNRISDRKKYIKQYDLFLIWHYDNAARRTSLKDLQFNMQMPNIEEMPIEHTHNITSISEIEEVLRYNKNDVIATNEFLNITLGRTDNPLYKKKDKIDLRHVLSKKFQVGCTNWNDVKLGEQLLLKLYCSATGRDYLTVRNSRTLREKIDLADCIPSWCDIKSNAFKEFVEELKATTIRNGIDTFATSVIFGGIKFDFGLGGTHGCAKPGVYKSTNSHIMIDLDVALS